MSFPASLPPSPPLPLSFSSQLSTLNSRLPFLIDNDMRSRETPCHCKHSTYEFLIDNEFHSLIVLRKPSPDANLPGEAGK